MVYPISKTLDVTPNNMVIKGGGGGKQHSNWAPVDPTGAQLGMLLIWWRGGGEREGEGERAEGGGGNS